MPLRHTAQMVRLRFAAMLAVLYAALAAGFETGRQGLNRDTAAVGSVVSIISVVFAVVGGIIVMIFLGTLGDDYFNAGSNATDAIQQSSWTDSTLGSLASPLGLLFGVGVLIGFVAFGLRLILD